VGTDIATNQLLQDPMVIIYNNQDLPNFWGDAALQPSQKKMPKNLDFCSLILSKARHVKLIIRIID
jgi:hypothetical protein